MNRERPETLGKYRLIERLGEGGMGTVYRARDEMLDRDVAIKLLRPDLVSQQALVARFRTEAIALARLAHPRIATLYGLEHDGNEFYMVMEYLPGETLEHLVQREGRLSWRRAAEICAQVAEALDHAHDQGVVHRDIKPANVMLGPAGNIKVMDFGIARMKGSSRQTQHGRSVGTPAYMAPEQLRGEECDGRTDLYALGAVFYELVTGRVAFEADSDYKLMMQQLNDPPPTPSATDPSIPAAIDRAVHRAMAKQPADRFISAAAMRNALLEATASTPLETRLVDDPGVTAEQQAPELVASTPQSATRSTPLWLDWRAWSTVSVIAVVLGVALSGGSEPNTPTALNDSNSSAMRVATPLPVRPGSGPAGSVERPLGGNATSPPAAPAPVRNSAPIALPSRTPAPVRRSAAPPPAPPPAAAPSPDPAPSTAPGRADDERAAAAAVRAWFAALGPGESLSGTLNGQPATKLLSDGRLEVPVPGAPTLSISGNTATATVTTTVQLRSAFGSSKRISAHFTLSLSRSGQSSWRVNRVSVQG